VGNQRAKMSTMVILGSKYDPLIEPEPAIISYNACEMGQNLDIRQ